MQSPIIKDRFVWDFTPIHKGSKLLGFTFLNAPIEFRENEQHHFHAQIGFARTQDFKTIDWIQNDVFSADTDGWDNSSIWSNDIIWHNEQWMMFYTSRDGTVGDGFTQSIGLATSNNLINWTRVPDFRLQADPKYYLTETIEGDPTIHAWRDPYLFCFNNITYMLLTAKDKTKPTGCNGCLALLKALDDNLLSWKIMPPITSPGQFSEMEEAEILISNNDEFYITFSSWAKYDRATHQGGLLSINLGKKHQIKEDFQNCHFKSMNYSH